MRRGWRFLLLLISALEARFPHSINKASKPAPVSGGTPETAGRRGLVSGQKSAQSHAKTECRAAAPSAAGGGYSEGYTRPPLRGGSPRAEWCSRRSGRKAQGGNIPRSDFRVPQEGCSSPSELLQPVHPNPIALTAAPSTNPLLSARAEEAFC